MFWKKGNNIFNSVKFKLTLWFSFVFTILFIVFFLVILSIISSNLTNGTDKRLILKIRQQISLGHPKNSDYQITGKQFSINSLNEGTKNTFHFYLDSAYNILASSKLKQWQNLKFDSTNIPYLPDKPIKKEIRQLVETTKNKQLKTSVVHLNHKFRSHTIIQTIQVKGRDDKIRVAFQHFNNNKIHIVGISLKSNADFIALLKKIFIYSYFTLIIIIGAILYLFTSKALKGVGRVKETARQIGENKISSRVPIGNEGIEIQTLAVTFNDMLDRIENLIAEQKEITHNIAHDLRSPLASIRGISETTITGASSIQDYKDIAGKVVDKCDKLTSLINAILDISDIETGLYSTITEKIDFKEILVDVYDMYHDLAEQKNIRFQYTKTENPLYVNGNKHLLQRAFGNIVDNAIKYTSSGGNVIMETTENNEKVITAITDNGIGISKEDQANIFKRFYRVDKSRSTNGNGIGLSLALAYIHFLHGEIKVESELNKGSVFKVFLPKF